MLAVIDLFQEGKLEWSAEEMMATLGYTRSTLYRYLKILSEAGYLTDVPRGIYTLGPCFVERDYLLRQSDPIIKAARPLMSQLAERFPGTVLLVRRYRDKVLCVHYERSRKDLRTSYARGRPMPLAYGATARAIVAFLPRAAMQEIVETHLEDYCAIGLGSTPKEVLSAFRKVRRQGYVIAHGEITPGVFGVAAPLLDQNGHAMASICLTIEERFVSESELKAIAQHVKFSASVISAVISEGPVAVGGA